MVVTAKLLHFDMKKRFTFKPLYIIMAKKIYFNFELWKEKTQS